MDLGKLLAFAQDIVRIPSFSGQEEQVARRIEYEMKALGYDAVWIDPVGNVIGVVEGRQPGPTLVFDAHMDTVGIPPDVPWQLDPFSGVIAEGRLHGRGSADMKGALAAMVHGVAGLERDRLRGRAVVSASVMEEVLEGVALARVIEQTGADFVVIGEATGLHVVRGGRGRAEIHLKTIGKPGHTSAPHLARNAVLDMVRVILAVENLTLPTDPLLGPALFGLSDIISEPYPGHSVIPSVCKVTYDRRTLPGETPAQVLDPIRTHPDLTDIRLEAQIGVGRYTGYTGETFVHEKFFPAWVLPEEHPFVVAAWEAVRSVGIPAQLTAYRFCTNAAYSAGVAGIPTVGFGPGQEGDAHQVDESISVQELIQAARGYQALAQRVLAA